MLTYMHARNKSKSVLIKLANIIINYECVPVTVTVKACLKAALLYGQETWSSSSLYQIETLCPKALTLTFNINAQAPNDIVSLETGFYDLKAEIYRAQYKFWAKITTNIEIDTNMLKIFQLAVEKNVHYLRCYINLHTEFHNEDECFKSYRDASIINCKENILLTKTNQNEYSIYHDCVI